jgi:hypothetical protein
VHKLIPLTQGKFALVDEQDFDHLMQWKWQSIRRPGGKFYVQRTEGPKALGQKTIYMAHAILPLMAGFFVDHINTNPLDNRRENLRYATPKDNSRNRGPVAGRSIKGVFWHAHARRWRAMIRVDGKLISLGLFKDKYEAAMAYDVRAVEEFGQFARPNFPAVAPKEQIAS